MIRCSMDLKQSKLTKDEWIAIERPMDGYTDVNLRRSTAPTLREFLKVQDSKNIRDFIFVRYLQESYQRD